MEIPYGGRAIINDLYDGVEIIIPAKKNWLEVAFSSLWLCGWAYCGTFALRVVTGLNEHGSGYIFMAFWLCVWAAGGAYTIRGWWWNIAGKEVITLTRGVLTLDKKGALFKKIKSYRLNQAENFRAYEDPSVKNSFGRSSQESWSKLAGNGTIIFDYGEETVKFGDRLALSEAIYILDRLRAKKLIS